MTEESNERIEALRRRIAHYRIGVEGIEPSVIACKGLPSLDDGKGGDSVVGTYVPLRRLWARNHSNRRAEVALRSLR